MAESKNNLELIIESNIPELTKSIKELTNATKNLLNHKEYNSALNAMNMQTQKYSKSSIKSFEQVANANVKTNTEMEKTVSLLKDAGINLHGFEQQTGDLITKMRSFLPYGVAMHFGINNIARGAFSATQETKEWSRELNTLSDSTGSTQLAISQMHQAFYMSGGSLSTVKSIMQSLAAQGIPNTTKGFEHLTAWITNMSLATGIGAESISTFSGVMIRNWKATIGQTEKMTSSVIAMQKAFNVTASEIDITMKAISDVVEKTGYFFKDGAKSAIAFTKGISQTIGILSKFGISTQRASEFVSGLLDTDKIGENLGLLNKLGISYQDYIDMLASGDAKQTLFDRLMTNLPHVSQQIQNIADPLARMNFAKSLGMPLEIAQKMAKATTGEIHQLMKEYKSAAEADKAMQEKQKKMADEASRFNETLHLMKRDALQPMMEWITKNIGHFWRGARIFFDFFKKYVGGLSNIFERGKNLLVPFMDVLEGKGSFPEFMGSLATGLIEAASDAFVWGWKLVANNFGTIFKNVIQSAGEIWGAFFSKYPILTTLASFTLALNTGSKLFGGIANFFTAFKGTRMSPMYVKDVDGVGGMIGKSSSLSTGKFGRWGGLIANKGADIAGKGGVLRGALGSVLGGAGSLVKMIPGMALASAGIFAFAGALSGASNAAEAFGEETSTIGKKLAGGISGALSGLTFGIMSKETQQALTRSIYYLFNSDEAKKALNKISVNIEERKKKGYVVSEGDIKKQQELQYNQSFSTANKVGATFSRGYGATKAAEVQAQMKAKDYEKNKGASEFYNLGLGSQFGASVAFDYANKINVSMEVLRNRIGEEHNQILAAYGKGLTLKQRIEKEKIEKELAMHESGEKILEQNEKARLDKRLKMITENEMKKADKENLIMRVSALSRLKQERDLQEIRVKNLQEGTAEHAQAVKRFNNLNKNYSKMVKNNGDISSSMVESFGVTAEGMNANLNMLINGFATAKSKMGFLDGFFGLGWETGKAREHLNISEKKMQEAKNLFYSSGSSKKYTEARDAAINQLTYAMSRVTENEELRNEIKNQKDVLTLYFKDLERTEEIKKKEAQARAKVNKTMIDINNGIFGKVKSIDDKTADSRTKTQVREDWLSSMIGFKGNIKIKSGLG